MKKTESNAALRALSVDELKDKVRGLSEEMMKLRFRKASLGQLDQSHREQEARKERARANTILTEKLQTEEQAAA